MPFGSIYHVRTIRYQYLSGITNAIHTGRFSTIDVDY